MEPERALGFALTFLDGKAVLGLEGRPLSLGRVDRLEMEVPGLRFPFDFSGGPSRFQNRRCRLRDLSLSVGAEDLAAHLRASRLPDHGIYEPRVTIAGGELRLEAQARLGGYQAAFTVRGALRAEPPRRARLSLYDVRVYGFFPVPAPLLATALLAQSGVKPDGQPGLLWLEGPTDLGLELVELALLGLLPAQGWRLPERGPVQARGLGEGTRLGMRFSAGPADRPGEHDLARKRHAAAEAALVRGELGQALEAYRQADDRFGVGRLLALLASSAGTLEEADARAGQALERWPDFVPALLARAAARRHEATDIYSRLAELAAGEGERVDEASALVAAGQDERAATVSPGHRGALRATAGKLAGQERWADVLRLVTERAGQEPDPAERAALHAEAGFLYLDRLGDPDRARACFEQATRLAPGEPAGWEGLGHGEGGRAALERALEIHVRRGDQEGVARVRAAMGPAAEAPVVQSEGVQLARAAEALRSLLDSDAPLPGARRAELAWRLAGLVEQQGDEDGALRWLRTCLEGEAQGPVAAGAWQRFVQITARRGDATAAAQGLVAWAEDMRTAEADRDRASHLLAAAGIFRERLGMADDAVVLLERALGLEPRTPGAFEALEAIATRAEDWGRLAEVLRRRLEVARPGEQRTLLRRLATLLAGPLAAPAEAVPVYRRLLELEPNNATAMAFLARHAPVAGPPDLERLGEAEAELQELLRGLPPDAGERKRQVRRQLARAHIAKGDWASARHHLELTSAEEPEAVADLESLVGVYGRLGLAAEAATCCERLARLYPAPEQRARALHQQGEFLLEGLGDREAASDAFLRATDLDPHFAPTLRRLVDHFWRCGDLTATVDVGTELVRQPQELEGVALMLALAAATVGRELGVPLPEASTGEVAARLAELASHADPRALEPALDALGAAADDPALVEALAERAEPGAVAALALLAERAGDLVQARIAYDIVAGLRPGFVPPELPALAYRAEAFRDGAVDHPLCGGPLRAALRGLGRLSAGMERLTASGLVAGTAVGPAVSALCESLATRLEAPPVTVVVQPELSSVVVVGTRPLALAVGSGTVGLPASELSFLVGRALEDARGGVFLARALLEDELLALMREALAGEGEVGERMTGEDELRRALGAAIEAMNVTEFLRGCRFTGDRVGMVAAGGPGPALRAMAVGDGGQADPEAVAALVAFALSPEHRALLAG
jgi:tetratricopeptide (TPR) repeat protein